MNTLVDNASTPESFFESMISLEQEISGASIASNEKSILLGAASVVRYSSYYWSSSDKENAWNAKLTMPVAFFDRQGAIMNVAAHNDLYSNGTWELSKKDNIQNGFTYASVTYGSFNPYFFSWKSLGKADLKGAIEGGVAGAIIGGSVSMGTLTVPAWAAGAVSWGAGCSVSNAIGQLFHWW